MHQLWPFLLDQLSHIVGDFCEALRLKQELVQRSKSSCTMMWSEIIRGA
jgi:hypothetical protein